MNNHKLLCLCILLAFATVSPAQQTPEVSNIRNRQLDYPSKVVEIRYDLEAVTETVAIRLLISDDGGETWDVPVENVEGDIGADIRVGHGKRILWDAGEDFPDHAIDEMRVRIIADDGLRGDEPEPGQERVFALTDDVDIVMVWIPAGEFNMGSPNNEQDRDNDEGPLHRVTFDQGFWMGKYEVTQGQWAGVMGNNPAHDQGVGANYPVYYVSWNDIQVFEERIADGFRLPSEAEWEYACRAGTNTRFYWGNDPNYREVVDYA